MCCKWPPAACGALRDVFNALRNEWENECVMWSIGERTMVGNMHASRHLVITSTNVDSSMGCCQVSIWHDDLIKWKHFPRYWPFVRQSSPVTGEFPTKGQWRGALMFSLICVWINGWLNNGEAGDLRRYRAHYDVTVMEWILHNSRAAKVPNCHMSESVI